MLWVKLCPAHPFTQDWHIEVLTSDFFFWKWGPCRHDIAIMKLDWIFVQSIWIWCLCKEKRRERDRDTQAEWQVMMWVMLQAQECWKLLATISARMRPARASCRSWGGHVWLTCAFQTCGLQKSRTVSFCEPPSLWHFVVLNLRN